jgi:hypothetical protein
MATQIMLAHVRTILMALAWPSNSKSQSRHGQAGPMSSLRYLSSVYRPRQENSHTDTKQAVPTGSERLPSPQLSPNYRRRQDDKPSAHTPMSLTQSTAASSPKFQLIINNALDTYRKRTKKDILTHPLAAQLQTCGTPAAILAILQEQVQGLDQSQRGDERWSKWLDPTVNVLFAFSSTIGAGVSLVFCRACYSSEICVLTFIWQVSSPTSVIFTGIGILLSVCTLFKCLRAGLL